MLEVMGLGVLLVVGVMVAAALAVVVGVLKLFFKILLIPVTLAFGALKLLLLAPLAILFLIVVGPVLVGIGLAILVPLLIVGLLAWGAVQLAAAV